MLELSLLVVANTNIHYFRNYAIIFKAFEKINTT